MTEGTQKKQGRKVRGKKDGTFFYPWERTFERLVTPFEKFIERETTSGLVLISFTVLAIVIANSPLKDLYTHLVHLPMGVRIGQWTLEHSALHWINEGLMALFFFVVGLEIKRQILVGELSDLRSAGLPIAAAFGGMIIPALIYYGINPAGDYAIGWAIPMTTDIAFCIGALVLVGRRVPGSLMVFMVSLAIVDDLTAVAVIAIFYTSSIQYWALGTAALSLLTLVAFNMAGVRRNVPYVIMGGLLWLFMLFSGVDAAVSGAVVAFCIPARARYNPSVFSDRLHRLATEISDADREEQSILHNLEQQTVLRSIDSECRLAEPPLQRMLDSLHLPVALIVIPLFALANAGIALDFSSPLALVTHPVSLGIVCGLVVGKPVGITLFSWICIRLGILSPPRGAGMRHIIGVSMLGGIGFTMSIFIAELSFGARPETLVVAKTGIILASLIAGILGVAWLLWVSRSGQQG